MKLSTILFILTFSQAAFIVASHYGWYALEQFAFDLLHEDTIFIMHLMTWFIVRAIEKTKET